MTKQQTPQMETKSALDETNNLNTYIIIFLVLFSLISSGIATYAIYQNNQLKKQIARLHIQVNRNTSLPSKLTPTLNPSENWETYSNKKYNFSFKYPSDWKLLEDSGTDLLLRETFSPDKDEKLIALVKDNIYLTIFINKRTIGRSGELIKGEEFEDFIFDKDKILINNSTFYLTESHRSFSSLEGTHSVQISLFEFDPEPKEQSGKVYTDSIVRNGYNYYFFVFGEKNEKTKPKIQDELIRIFETINW